MRKMLLAVAGAALLLSGCSAVTIAKINADPTRYYRKDVRVNGTVTNSFGIPVAGFYQVDDGTGKIYVISNGGAPAKGARVRVDGTVVSGATFMGTTFGTAIREREHKVK